MKIAPLAVLALLTVGCTTSPDPAAGREVAFSCTNGESLSVRFLPEREVAVLLRHGDEIELQQQVSGSGFIYGNGPNTIRGKGNELTVEIGRRVPIQCTAK